MLIALCVPRITNDMDSNFSKVLRFIHEAGEKGANLVLFPEAVLTGLANNDNPVHDLPLGIEIPGNYTDTLCELATRYRLHIGIGVLERENNKLYDTAILIAPDKGIVLKYRRISPGWHGRNIDPEVYGHGKEVKKINTPLGSFAFLICGDLFDDRLVSEVKKLKPDWLLVPFARSFDDESYNQERWDVEEKPKYIKRVKMAGVTTLLVNYLAGEGDSSFGGAMVVSSDGEIIAEFPLGREGILFVKV